MTSEPIQPSTVHGAPPEVELLDPRNRTDPYQVYAALREGPALRRSFLGYWIAARYAEVSAILKDTRFVASASAAGLSEEAAASAAGRAGQPAQALVLPFLPQADHELVRQLLQPYFSRQATQARTPVIERIAQEVIAEAARDRTFDLVRDVAYLLTRKVIASTVGLTLRPEDAAKWEFALSRNPDPVVGDAGPGRRSVAAIRALHDIVERALDGPELPDGSVFRGLRDAVARRELRRELAVENGAFLLAAGHETTMTWITSTLFCLLRDRQRWDAACAGESSVHAAVEEALRLETPVQVTTRVASVAAEVGGHEIARGEAIWLLMGSANRDERVYPHAAEFRPGRGGPRALAFGGGAYYCTGALMAGREAELTVGALVRALPGLRLSARLPPEWHKTVMMRSLRHLRVEQP